MFVKLLLCSLYSLQMVDWDNFHSARRCAPSLLVYNILHQSKAGEIELDSTLNLNWMDWNGWLYIDGKWFATRATLKELIDLIAKSWEEAVPYVCLLAAFRRPCFAVVWQPLSWKTTSQSMIMGRMCSQVWRALSDWTWKLYVLVTAARRCMRAGLLGIPPGIQVYCFHWNPSKILVELRRCKHALGK